MRAIGNVGKRPSQSGISMIELLVSIVVMGILSTMILLMWFTLQSSYASSEQNAVQRDNARLALWRMAAEIRDAQGMGDDPLVTSTKPNEIVITTSFNNVGNTTQPSDPTAVDTNVHRVRYRYNPADSKVYRAEDTKSSGAAFAAADEAVYLKNVVNGLHDTPVFRYSYFDTHGVLQTVDSLSAEGVDMSQLLNVQIRLLVDIKPNKSPTYMDLQTTVQPRNALRGGS